MFFCHYKVDRSSGEVSLLISILDTLLAKGDEKVGHLAHHDGLSIYFDHFSLYLSLFQNAFRF